MNWAHTNAELDRSDALERQAFRGQWRQGELGENLVAELHGAQVGDARWNIQRRRQRFADIAAAGEPCGACKDYYRYPHRMYRLRSWSFTMSASCLRT